MDTERNALLLDPSYLVLEPNPKLFKIVGQRNFNRTAVATHHIKKDEVVYNILPYSSKTSADFLTVQFNTEEHILDQLLEAMNHSCSPTTFVDILLMQVIALRDISPGEELTFFYPSTEWEMDRPFQCNCRSSQCIDFVTGAKKLAINQMIKFRLNPHIKSLIKHSLNLD
ncbi:SET domain-containing protein-lysine N-methyltransferase [Amazonocrinis nigriterrae]|uniref:SET domain-containing protein-lysine N-methyltransferase n=1 Tax=Amazonocrinis nigriterrae TaxID=2840443 RepID=UPI001CED3C01|nr:SET domain-containing protein-lysine N-methyltransferase [Amazonocrinis nigriterrae]